MSTLDLIGRVYEPGTVIFAQGEPGDTMYLIQSGSVEYSYTQGDAETVLTILERGDFIGEMALFGQERRPATTRAIRQTRLLHLTRAALQERIYQDPDVALHLLEGLYLRIQHADIQIQQAVKKDEVLRQALTPAPDRAEQASGRATAAAAGLSLAELASLWDVEQETLWFEPGQTIYSQGDAGTAIYVVLSGSVELASGSGSDKYVLFNLNPGDFFGEVELIAGLPRTATTTALDRTELLPIPREEFLERIKQEPELALFILRAVSVRLQNIGLVLANPRAAVDSVRQNWRPLLGKQERIKMAMVSLSTCAGCPAVFLDQEGLDQVLEIADVAYCPMLVDQDHIPEVDVALLDGGEPLTHPEILDITADLPGIVFPLFTNGLLIDERTIGKLEGQRHVIPVISLEGRQAHTDGQRGQGVYAHLQGMMATMVNRGIFFGTLLTVTRQNFAAVTGGDFIGELVARGCRVFFYVDYVPVQEGTENLALTEEQKAMEASLMMQFPSEFPALFVSFPGGEDLYGGCLAAGRGFVHISPGGRVEPCPFSPFSDASLNEVSLKEALQSDLLRTIRESDVHLGGTDGGCALWEHREWVASLLQPGEKALPGTHALGHSGKREIVRIPV